jgi:hypothetical protein
MKPRSRFDYLHCQYVMRSWHGCSQCHDLPRLPRNKQLCTSTETVQATAAVLKP